MFSYGRHEGKGAPGLGEQGALRALFGHSRAAARVDDWEGESVLCAGERRSFVWKEDIISLVFATHFFAVGRCTAAAALDVDIVWATSHQGMLLYALLSLHT
jgi:hypothetical protein